jgi:cold shock protein
MYERRPPFFRTGDDGQLTGRRVEAVVKWFNPEKGFGFVTCTEDGAEAFLPVATLRRIGLDDVREGQVMACEIGAGAKGPLVVAVLHVERSAARAAANRPAPKQGTVKWFEPGKGFGFIAPDGGGKDIIVHASALRRCGVVSLGPGQRVRVEVIEGRKGLEADRVTLL